MKKFLLLVFLFVASQSFGQGKVLDVFSSKLIGDGNIQTELYQSNASYQIFDSHLSHLWLRYGMSKTVEIQARISRRSDKNTDMTNAGILPISIGAKINVYEGRKSALAFTTMSILPVGSDFFAETEFGFHFDMAYERRFNDVFNLGMNAGFLSQGLEGFEDIPYMLVNAEIAVTNWLDVYGQLEYVFPTDHKSTQWSTGAWLWVSEDIRLFFDYGKSISNQDFEDRVSFGLLLRWLD